MYLSDGTRHKKGFIYKKSPTVPLISGVMPELSGRVMMVEQIPHINQPVGLRELKLEGK